MLLIPDTVLDLECDRLYKAFGGQAEVDDISLSIPAGPLFSILGPSGCGKTTLFDVANSRITASIGQGSELTVRLPQTPEYARLRPGDWLQLGWMGNQAQYFAAGCE